MKKQSKLPPLEYLNECFRYDAGRLFWNKRPPHHFESGVVCEWWNARWAGDEVGTVNQNGYVETTISGKAFKVHRLIAAMHGIETTAFIDHVNGNKQDNRIENLRAASSEENGRNSTASWSSAGQRGVTIQNGGFCAYISVEKRKRHLGTFKTIEEALAVRRAAVQKHYGAFAPTGD